jgi:glycerophosphoryl diester phosphodiesterase
MAHRGGSDYEPNLGKENTMTAFTNAVALGYRYIETDVQATKDGVLVCMHDDTLERVAGIQGTVRDFTAAELHKVRIDQTESVPFFDDVVEAFPHVRFNVDMKVSDAVDPLWEAVRAHHLHDRILVDSFSQSRISRFRRLSGGKIPTAMAPLGVVWASQVPLLPRFFGSSGVALQVPVADKVGPVLLKVVTSATIERVHAAGKVVHVWTVNDTDEMIRLIDMGVDGIFTDRPDLLKEVLVAKNMWEDS